MVTPPKGISKTDRAAFIKTSKSNTFNKRPPQFKNKESARQAVIKDFKNKYESKFPSKFNSKPTERPEWIPKSTTINGRSRDVVYRNHQGVGGYYYQNAAGQWILYQMMADSVMRDRYAYRYGYDPSGRYYVRRRSRGISWFWIVIIVIVIIVGISLYSSWKKKRATVGPPRRRSPSSRRPAPRRKKMRPRPRTDDPLKPSYWQDVEPGDLLTLKNEQTIELLMESGRDHFASGVDLRVRTVHDLVERNQLLSWHWYELESFHAGGREHNWSVFVKRVDQDFDLRITFEPPDFPMGDREQQIAWENYWLFNEPANPDHFNPGDLEFVDELPQEIHGKVTVYKKKPQGSLYAEMRTVPKPRGVKQPELVQVVEYLTEQDHPNPELILLEIGDHPRGGFIRLFQGTNVQANDLELTRRS